MIISKQATAGTLESSDCLVIVSPCDHKEVLLNSVSQKRFGAHLEKLIDETLQSLNIQSGHIEINDRGALDYCLKARIISAIQRSSEGC